MKKLILLAIIFAICYAPTFGNNHLPNLGEDDIILLDNEQISYSIKYGFEFYVESALFIEESSDIFLEINENIEFLQVLNSEGVLEYQIPISADKINITTLDLESGTYTMNLILKSNVVVSTTINKM